MYVSKLKTVCLA